MRSIEGTFPQNRNSLIGSSLLYRLLALPVHDYFHSFHADLKAIAYATDTDSGTASHPGCYCERKTTVDVALAKQLTADKLRNCTPNRRHFKNFIRSGDDTAKKHANCSSNPLQLFPQTTPIISWCQLPELRLHLKCYINHLCLLHPQAERWIKHFNQIQSEIHG